jgi:hypothetical protein
MMSELQGQLSGGHKIHALNAALIYNIDPSDAKKHFVTFQGQQRSAYDAGKRLAHAYNYGMDAPYMSKLYWLPLKRCQEIVALLATKYTKTETAMRALGDRVFGVFEYRCARCKSVSNVREERCPCMASTKLARQYAGCVIEPARQFKTLFGRRRLYLGRRDDGMNALRAQPAQSGGASLWYRTLLRLHGYDYYAPDVDVQWTMPLALNPLVWSPRVHVYGQLYAPFEVYVVTGTYDSFIIECDAQDVEAVAQWLAWTMEQGWPELGGLRIPVELSWGYNWRKASEANPKGLVDMKYDSFSARAA